MVQSEFTMISDKQKGLIQAFETMLPAVRHRFCVRHLHNNMRVAGFTANTIKDALWKAARATTINSFRTALQELRNLDEEAFAWLGDKRPSEWSRSHFTGTANYDILVNNISESFNAMILQARESPVINCLEIIRKKIMLRLFELRTQAAQWTGIVCPNIVRKIDEIEKLAGGLIGYQSAPMLFEIIGTHSGQYTVDLGRRVCSCRKWDLTGIPCPHVVCAIWIKHGKGPIWRYVDSCYLISTYMKTYEGCIKPMSGYEDWPATSREPPLPPVYNARPGRPRKLRMKSRGEGQHLSRRYVVLHCTKCKEVCHNNRKCLKFPTVRPATQLRRRARSRGAARVQVPAQAAQIADEATVQVPVAAAQIGDEAAVQVPAQAAQIGDEPAVQVQVAVEPNIICQPEIEDNLWEIPDDILDAHWHEIEVQTQNNLVEASLSTNSEIPVIQVPFEQEKRLKGKQGMVPKISRKRTASKDFNRQKQPVRKYGTRSSTTFKSKFSVNDKDPINLD